MPRGGLISVSPNTCYTLSCPRGIFWSVAGSAQAGSPRGRGGLAASPLARLTACPRCPPAAASQRGLIGSRDSFSRFPSPGSRHSLPQQIPQGRSPSRKTLTPGTKRGEMGCWEHPTTETQI